VTTADVRLAAAAPTSADDPRVVRALEEYIAAMEAGAPPPRDEFLKRHPEVAAALADCLVGLEMVHHAGQARPAGDPASAPAADGRLEPLGDFEIVREIGRGGMGVVYEAVQRSLGRRVALKVLPFAATMDPRHLQRFHNEARAAASLHHPHIVPVYAVGQERGVHFYAMQFIDGRTLADVIVGRSAAGPAGPAEPTSAYPPVSAADTAPAAAADTSMVPRNPAFFRRVAEWGVQAAEALEYAHALGVVHRDVKPANLMVDAQGTLWVTDFGLARISADSGLTMTGDLLGTLRYMSPEQALAKHGLVDHRTDVYALGATLYELLTGRPSVDGKDRAEVLRKLIFEEPAPPRSLDRSLPADLETVVLKALAKEPRERYATAKALADDLRRFLEDKPILAKPPTRRQRLVKWGRRHKSVVVSGVALLVLALIGSLISLGLIASAYNAEAKQREKTEGALAEAGRQQARADDNFQKTTEALAEAGRQQARADDNFQKAIEEISQLVKAAEDDPKTGRTPQLEEVRKAQSDRSLAFYQGLLQENRADPAGRLQTGLLYRELLTRYAMRGDTAKAMEAYEQAVALFQQLTVEVPEDARYLEELKKSHLELDNLRQASFNRPVPEITSGRYKEAAKFYQQAITMAEALIAEQPDEPSPWFTQGAASGYLGYELWAAGQTKEAEESFSKALPIFEKLARHPRFVPQLVWLFESHVYEWRGKLRAETGRFQEAEADYHQALALLEKLPKDKFWLGQQQIPFASTQEALGSVLWATDRHEEAAQAFRQAEDVRRQRMRAGDKGFVLPNHMAWFLAACPDKQFRNPTKAVEVANEAVEEVRKFAEHSPRDEGDCWKTLGVAHYRAGDWEHAVAALEKAMQLRDGGDGADWFFLAMAHYQLGDTDKARTWYDKAVEWTDKNRPKDEELARFRAEAGALLKMEDKQKAKPD
jgi:serine/threonine protein kinase